MPEILEWAGASDQRQQAIIQAARTRKLDRLSRS